MFLTFAKKMASLHLPVPGIVNVDAENVSTVFRDWKQQCIHYSRAVDLTSKSELVQVSTLLTCMGNEARRIFDILSGRIPKIKITLKQCYNCLRNTLLRWLIFPSKDFRSILETKSQVKVSRNM